MEIRLTEPEDTIITLEEGSPGLSAYELALVKGFEGTLEEWLAGLEGNPGPPTNIEIGDVETLPSGAEAYLRMRGTAPNLILDAGLVSGADGSGGGDSQLYIHHMVDPADLGEGWEAYLSFIRTGNVVTISGWCAGAEGVATSIVTDKIPMGYRPIFPSYVNAFLVDQSSGTPSITSTTMFAAYGSAFLSIEENPVGMYYISTMAYVTLDDPPEPDIPVEPEGPFNVAITGHSTDGSYLPASEPISFPDGAMGVRFETDAVTPFDGLEIWDYNTGDWYIANVGDNIIYDVVGPGKHVLVWETANTIYKPFEFPETFMLQYKFIKGNDEVIVEDTITFSSDTVELLPIDLHNRSVDGMVSWQTLSNPVSLEDISSYSVGYYADYTITPDPEWPGTIEYAEYSESSLDWVTVPTESIQHYEGSSWTFTPNVTYTKQTPTPNGQVQILYRFTSGGRVIALNDIIDVVE